MKDKFVVKRKDKDKKDKLIVMTLRLDKGLQVRTDQIRKQDFIL